MPKEIFLQKDMFSGEVVDTRTHLQRQRDQKQSLPQSVPMFAQHEIAQFGVAAHPLLPIAPTTKLALVIEDHRTPEEIERDTQKEAERRTHPIFELETDSLEDYERTLFEVAQVMGLPFSVL